MRGSSPRSNDPKAGHGDAAVGLMIVVERDQDWRLLGIARAVEAALHSHNEI